MAKSKLVKFVHEYLENEFQAVSAGHAASVVSDLSLEERALIYKYSEDGYEGVNRSLRESLGKTQTELGKFLDATLKKLPNYQGLVYRSADLSATKLKRYTDAYDKNTILEYV